MRFVYNTTFHLPDSMENIFKEHIQKYTLPYLREEGVDFESLFTRVHVKQEEGRAFSLQLIFPTEKEYNKFLNQYRDDIFEDLHIRHGNQVLYFNTLLEEIC